MGRYVEGINVNQIMLGFSFDDMIEEDNPVRAIASVVDCLAQRGLELSHSHTKATGRPPYNPVTMLKIYIYCYYNKIRSSRCIEKECKRNIELIWLTGGLAPDYKTISDFRKNNKKAIENLHLEFIKMCKDMGLIGCQTAALDGTKIRANNSRKNNVTINKLEKMISHYEESLHEYLAELAQNDIAENTSNIRGKIKAAEEKINECEKTKEEMLAENVREKSLTDPDSHKMSVANKGTEIAYNVQNVVDDKVHLIVTTDVATSPADQTQLYSMSKKAADELGSEDLAILADKGYVRADDLKECEDDGRINAIVAPTKEKGTEGYRKSDFVYNAEDDTYICPMGNVMRKTGIITAEYHNFKACAECPNRDKCTKSKKGRNIVRGQYEDVLERAEERYRGNKELYRKRQCLVEHPFGTIKRTLGFTYFLTRGLESVRTENFLHVITYNLIRLLNIFGVPRLTALLKGKTCKTEECDGEVNQHNDFILVRFSCEIKKLTFFMPLRRFFMVERNGFYTT